MTVSVSFVVFYLFFQSQNQNLDPLTQNKKTLIIYYEIQLNEIL